MLSAAVVIGALRVKCSTCCMLLALLHVVRFAKLFVIMNLNLNLKYAG